mgnify:CR=1 FL=1
MADLAEAQSITSLLDKARADGRADVCVGKRRWRRYRLGAPLEVTHDPDVCGATWRVITHNISGGGLGFWSSHAFALGDRLYVREYHDGQDSQAWVRSRVCYCVLGINGYLVGVAYDHPADPDLPLDPGRFSFRSRGEGSRRGARRPHQKLSWWCLTACVSGVGTAAALAAAYGLHDPLKETAGPVWAWPVLVLLAGAVGTVVGWLIGAPEARAIAAVREALDRLCTGTPSEAPLPEARTRDIDEMRQAVLNLGGRWKEFAEAERRQRERLEEVNQLKTNVLSMVSHDLRTPLTSIQLYTQMLSEDLDHLSQEDQRRFLNTISEESHRLSRLVTDLLEVQRLEGGAVAWEMRPIDVVETIGSVVRVFEPIAANKGIPLVLECEERVPAVTANADKIAQALSNLLSNAMKYSPAGRAVRVRAEARREEIHIVVGDEGPGIPRDKWDSIFDRFAQLGTENLAGSQGVGLGLYIVSQIVDRHGGRVWVDSQPGQGSEFTIALPAGGSRPHQAEASGAAEPAGRVVVCDADPALAALLAQILRDRGFEVRLAHSGSRLFEQLEEYQPDIVLTDVSLPDMRSSDLLQGFRERGGRRFSLILHSMRGDERELRLRGADVFLERPATRDELIRGAEVVMHKGAKEGLVVLLLNHWGLDCDRLSQHLVARGHLPILAQDLPSAVTYLRTYPIDLVLVKLGPEGPGSEALRALRALRGDDFRPVRLCALAEQFSEKECRELSEDDVTFLPFSPGGEEGLAEAIGAAHEQKWEETVV